MSLVLRLERSLWGVLFLSLGLQARADTIPGAPPCQDILILTSDDGWSQIFDWAALMSGSCHTVQVISVNAGDPNGFSDDLGAGGISLCQYSQVWDMRLADGAAPENIISASDQAAFAAYLAGGGRLVLVGEGLFYSTRVNSLRNYLSSSISTSGGFSAPVDVPDYASLNAADALAAENFGTDYNVLGDIHTCYAGGFLPSDTGSALDLYMSAGYSVVQVFYGSGIQPALAAGRVAAIWDTNIIHPSFCDPTGYSNDEFVLNMIDFMAGASDCSVTPVASATQTPSATRSPTRTPSPTRSHTRTPSPSPSPTPTPGGPSPAVDLIAERDVVYLNDEFSLRARVRNTGAGAAGPVTVTVTLPPELGLLDPGGGSATGSTITWILPGLAAGESADFVLLLQALSAGNGTPVWPSAQAFFGDPSTLASLPPAGDAASVLIILPDSFSVDRNAFRVPGESVQIRFSASGGGGATLSVYNSSGELIQRLFGGNLVLGREENFSWDGTNQNKDPVASGVYLLRLETKTLSATRRIAVIR